MDVYWRAANYLSVGQIHLYDNPLLEEPLTPEHVKPLVEGPLSERTDSSGKRTKSHGVQERQSL
jgi:phosphoketolase